MSYLDVWLKYQNHTEKYFHSHNLIDSMIPPKNDFKYLCFINQNYSLVSTWD